MSGIAIVNVFIALILSLWRSIIKLLFKRNRKVETSIKRKLGLFSEGNQYRLTFEPLIKFCIENKVETNYYTLDINDPFLHYDSPLFHPVFLGFGQFGYNNFSKINDPVIISTTPNIGNSNHPLKKPSNGTKLIHVFHSISDISIYRKHSLDNYDQVFLIGGFQEKMIRLAEQKRRLKPKTLHLSGAPYFDSLLYTLEQSKPDLQNSILIASSWGKKGLINAFPLTWIETLAKRCKREIIIRPHPQSFISDMDAIKEIKNLASKYINLKLDREISPLQSMSMSSILISDTSSIRYDFAFLLERPVITIDIPKSNLSEYEASDFDVSWDLESRIFIGQVVLNPSDINNELIEDVITHYGINDNINDFKNKTFNSTGNSAELIIKKSLEYLS